VESGPVQPVNVRTVNVVNVGTEDVGTGDGGTGDGETGDVGRRNGANGRVTTDILQNVVDDFIPPTYPEEVELQTLAAVLECTSQALLPERYQSMDRESIVKRVQELKRFV
jgi:hypothetical protein